MGLSAASLRNIVMRLVSTIRRVFGTTAHELRRLQAILCCSEGTLMRSMWIDGGRSIRKTPASWKRGVIQTQNQNSRSQGMHMLAKLSSRHFKVVSLNGKEDAAMILKELGTFFQPAG